MARHFPDFIEAYLEHTSGHEGTRKTHLWSCMSILAGALERRVWYDRGFYKLFPNLYVFIIGKSGLIKKSTTTGIAVDLFRELKDCRLMSERLTAASLIHQMSLADTKFECGGFRIRQSAVFAYASELKVFLEEVNGGILDLLTTFYDCVPNDPNKPWVYSTKNKGTTAIYGPCLNILAASTKAWLKQCLPRKEQEGGFTSRVLFVVENDAPDKLVAWPEAPADPNLRRKLIADLMQIHQLAGVASVTDEAKAHFADWYEYHMRKVVPHNTDPAFSGYLGRKGDLILKLALIRCASLSNRLLVTKEHLHWAGHALERLEPDMKGAFQDYVMPIRSSIILDIFEFVKLKGFSDRAEVKKAFLERCPIPLIDKGISELLTTGELVNVQHDAGDGRGMRMMLRPASHL